MRELIDFEICNFNQAHKLRQGFGLLRRVSLAPLTVPCAEIERLGDGQDIKVRHPGTGPGAGASPLAFNLLWTGEVAANATAAGMGGKRTRKVLAELHETIPELTKRFDIAFEAAELLEVGRRNKSTTCLALRPTPETAETISSQRERIVETLLDMGLGQDHNQWNDTSTHLRVVYFNDVTPGVPERSLELMQGGVVFPLGGILLGAAFAAD